MVKKEKLTIELEKLDYSVYDKLTKEDTEIIHGKLSHLKKLSNLLSISVFLPLTINFIDNFKYSEYVFFIASIIMLTVLVYICISRIKTKNGILVILDLKRRLKSQRNGVRIKVYYNKVMDILDSVAFVFVLFWSLLSMFWSVFKITTNF
ncbi:hypothetical protein [Staphylococcus equorum]|uniref:hypothetical protein n=1 Tax=Staphylococcus equorum TaxID=246432 RepID=UPI0008536A31|nr:hypothetical protein [Staphylococcus equorum]OEK60602.1 hypothetical protein ASS99_11105 [Staphylococcus equorum]